MKWFFFTWMIFLCILIYGKITSWNIMIISVIFPYLWDLGNYELGSRPSSTLICFRPLHNNVFIKRRVDSIRITKCNIFNSNFRRLSLDGVVLGGWCRCLVPGNYVWRNGLDKHGGSCWSSVCRWLAVCFVK